MVHIEIRLMGYGIELKKDVICSVSDGVCCKMEKLLKNIAYITYPTRHEIDKIHWLGFLSVYNFVLRGLGVLSVYNFVLRGLGAFSVYNFVLRGLGVFMGLPDRKDRRLFWLKSVNFDQNRSILTKVFWVGFPNSDDRKTKRPKDRSCLEGS